MASSEEPSDAPQADGQGVNPTKARRHAVKKICIGTSSQGTALVDPTRKEQRDLHRTSADDNDDFVDPPPLKNQNASTEPRKIRTKKAAVRVRKPQGDGKVYLLWFI